MSQALVRVDPGELVQVLLKKLFNHEFSRVRKNIEALVSEHDQIMLRAGREVRYGFLFDGVSYRLSVPPIFHHHLFGLDISLNDQMEGFLSDKRQLKEELQLARQSLHMLLKDLGFTQDIRDALPDFLAYKFTDEVDLSALPRSRSEAFTIESNERAQRQWAKIRPRLEFYNTTRLLY